MHPDNPGLSEWSTTVHADAPGWWTYRVEGWSDPYATWAHDAGIKIDAGVDEELMCAEGVRVLERFAESVRGLGVDASAIEKGITALGDTRSPAAHRYGAATSPEIRGLASWMPLRQFVSPTKRYTLLVERERALYGAWYEIFPRSEGARRDPETGAWTSGTLRTAAERLPAIAGMGFDVVYLTPIHPIGTTARKGRNNTLVAEPGDPGSPYAIGSPDGGHDSIHPDLGTFEDFDHFVAEAGRHGLEVAMDLALQASPDHPWVRTHPEMFTTRADGTVAYAENPPKKYQDIYPVNFDNDPAGAYAEVRRVIQVWLDHGVRIFRVDNPHTKPVAFWQWLIADVGTRVPRDDLALGGLHEAGDDAHAGQGRVPAELHVLRLAQRGVGARGVRPRARRRCRGVHAPLLLADHPRHPHALHAVRRTDRMEAPGRTRSDAGADLWHLRGLRADGGHRPAGAEEQIDNEKYEYKDRQWSLYEPGGPLENRSLAWYLRRLNEIRGWHPALRWLRNLRFHGAEDDSFLVYSKTRVVDGQRDTVLVVANLDPHATRETWVHLDLEAMGMASWSAFDAHDHVTNQTWTWRQDNYVRLGPDSEPVHIFSVRSH